MSKRLGRQEWIDVGLMTLAAHGPDAVRVERLAESLGVTKGSFYWHFKDRCALLGAMLEAWQSLATNAVIETVESKGGDARARLSTLFTIVFASDGRLDHAVRSWAAQDELARSTLDAIDRRRFDYLVSLFTELGFKSVEARARARFAYHALIGQFMVGKPAALHQGLSAYLDVILPMLVRAGPPDHKSPDHKSK